MVIYPNTVTLKKYSIFTNTAASYIKTLQICDKACKERHVGTNTPCHLMNDMGIVFAFAKL